MFNLLKYVSFVCLTHEYDEFHPWNEIIFFEILNVRDSVLFLWVYYYCGYEQILGVHDQAEKDEIVKSVMHLRNAQIEEGYTEDVVVSRKVGVLFFVNL